MEKWQERLIPEQVGIKEPEQTIDDDRAEETARRTRELLDSQGWCLWRSHTLGGDIIAVVLDESVAVIPSVYPVYTVVELEEFCRDDLSEATLRLIHEVKKLAGAKVTTEVTTKIAK